ncbi:Zn-binding domain-containing protein [Actinokineospora sp.]|uniref:Zn-binding domain-containing protein n=1 Tax=Actinokineospora sp. TaxID=1872133 RepID=UPI003D6C42EA
MNALANDQARRIAAMVDGHGLSDVRVGLYTGDAEAGAGDGLLRQRRELRDNPPDILLTNYKMLDFLLLRPEDAPLWAEHALQYLVLDEFHTYDGAQGTDVAMLLRRLGMALGQSTPGRPLGSITPVATSATLGDGSEGGRLLEFAGRVFGEPFDSDAVIGERRLSPGDWLDDPAGQSLPLHDELPPLWPGLSHMDRLRQTAQVFFGDVGIDDRHALGLRLRGHPLTHALLDAAATPRAFAEVIRAVAPSWAGRPNGERVLAEYLGLLSHARDGDRPLLQVDIQLWVREVRRLDRIVDSVPDFQWSLDSPRTEIDERFLPAVYCRHCGRSGWGALRRSRDIVLDSNARTITQQSVSKSGRFRAMLHAPGERRAGDQGALSWLDPVTLELFDAEPKGDHACLPVLATPDDEASKRDTCPSCQQRDGIRFLGSRVATLTSVALGHLFGSSDVEPDQKKTLVFADSVQDASHRAGFIEARSFTFNFRSLLHRSLNGNTLTLAEIADAMKSAARTPAERYALLPPDLLVDDTYRDVWENPRRASAKLRTAITTRAGFNAILEFGLNARAGRTLELTGTVVAHVDAGSPTRLTGLAESVIAEHRDRFPQLDLTPPAPAALAWIRGVLERIRLQGGINHPWLTKYRHEDGNRWSIWGGRPAAMPAFPTRRPAPVFPTTAVKSEPFDSVVAKGTWYCRWTARCLGLAESEGPFLVRALFEAMHKANIVSEVKTKTAASVYYLEPDSVVLHPTEPGHPQTVMALLRCDVCSYRFPAAHEIAGQLRDGRCLRDRCAGTLRDEPIAPDYYRVLYTSREVRRITAHEHTGMLDAETRVKVETAFKSSDAPDAPNVLTCTPTLELGIDIGDLSAVGLTSLPRSVAGHLQRVGRAGRQTGSALVFAVLPGRGIELHWLAEPLDMIAGEVTPPACHLDAVEIIRRQYFASLVDRAARAGKGKPPRTAGRMFTAALSEGSWLSDLLRDARDNADTHVREFVDGFQGHIMTTTADMLADWAGVGLDRDIVSPLERAVDDAVKVWLAERDELRERAAVMEAEITRLTEIKNVLGSDDVDDLRRVRGEHRAARSRMSGMARQYWITAFEALGLLPNYTLLDDRTRLDVGLTWTDENGKPSVDRFTYERGSRVALRELAPGNTFYVNGSALRIDAVDVGSPRKSEIVRWRFCPRCGWSAENAGPTTCPRCGDNRAADTGSVLPVVRFKRASAFAPRDSTRFGDEDDDRQRRMFTVATTVDAQDVQRAWGLTDYPFGAEFARRADIRWVNLGRADTGGVERIIGGESVQAPLFLACKHCGVVPAAQDRDTADARHRGWCPQRGTPEPDGWTSLALLHELRTQAVRLLVPPIVIADDTLLQSMRAALLLGLRRVLGGEPDHLDVVIAPDVDRHHSRHVLVLHDLVPGGTGYLARFADPDAVRALLAEALKALEQCPCADRPVQACHRCLLAYAPPAAVPVVRRDRAVELLRDILANWSPRDLTSLRDVTVSPRETPIELRLRALLHRWAKQEKAEPRLAPGTGGDRLEFTFGSGSDSRVWTMEAQPGLGYVRPDFVLSCSDGRVPRVAVFCDGRQFHATAEHNRLADDADKRANLRADDYVVWALTHDDLDAFEQAIDGVPATGYPYLSNAQRLATEKVADKFATPRTETVARMQGDAVTLLTRFLRRPDPDAWQGPAQAIAVGLVGGTPGGAGALDRDQIPDLLARELRGQHPVAVNGKARILLRRSARGAVAVVDLSSKQIAVRVGVDDRDETIDTVEESWRDWLALSNVLQFLGPERFSAGTTSVPVPGGLDAVPAAPTSDPAWRELVAARFGGSVEALIAALAGLGLPAPEPGYEAHDGQHVVDLAWPQVRVAVSMDADTERDAALVADGWLVVAPHPDVVAAAVRGTA